MDGVEDSEEEPATPSVSFFPRSSRFDVNSLL